MPPSGEGLSLKPARKDHRLKATNGVESSARTRTWTREPLRTFYQGDLYLSSVETTVFRRRCEPSISSATSERRGGGGQLTRFHDADEELIELLPPRELLRPGQVHGAVGHEVGNVARAASTTASVRPSASWIWRSTTDSAWSSSASTRAIHAAQEYTSSRDASSRAADVRNAGGSPSTDSSRARRSSAVAGIPRAPASTSSASASSPATKRSARATATAASKIDCRASTGTSATFCSTCSRSRAAIWSRIDELRLPSVRVTRSNRTSASSSGTMRRSRAAWRIDVPVCLACFADLAPAS